MPRSLAASETARTARLRRATQSVHQQLEHSAPLQPLLAPDLTAAQYTRLLSQFFGFYESLEKALFPLPSAPFRPKTPALWADLARCGFDDAQCAALPRWPAPPTLTAEETVGVIYVLEGAALGGQLITRHLRQSLGATWPDIPHRFYGGDGQDTGRQWRRVTAWLDAYPATDEERVIHGALGTFRTFHAWLHGEILPWQ